ncbi:MAG: hypothetical protein EA369_05980 [Bradymonadales bacterium]|nr:MAG: hypothetical protein EA369_05980 [Bradymonadales bacterium]
MKACQLLEGIAVRFFFLFIGLAGLSACVPKTSYEDKLSELERLQAERRAQEWDAGECRPETLANLREHIRSLDILSQELVDRNTELSQEVARLRTLETERGRASLDCDRRLREQATDYEQQLERTRATYEDMIETLRKQLNRP